MNSNELIIRIISIESPRQETAGQKNKYTIETERSHIFFMQFACQTHLQSSLDSQFQQFDLDIFKMV